MSTVAAIRRMLAAGMDIETALIAAEAFEVEAPVFVPPQNARQARNQRYYDSKRLKASETKTPKTVSDASDAPKTVSDAAPPSRTGTQVVIPSLPSLRSEELKPPVSPNGLTAPKGSETARGSRIPENWSPVPDYDPVAYGLSHAQHDAELAKFLDYWRSVPGAKGRKTDWPATWRNWMRRASETQPRKAHERPYADQRQAAREDGLRAHQSGAMAALNRRLGSVG